MFFRFLTFTLRCTLLLRCINVTYQQTSCLPPESPFTLSTAQHLKSSHVSLVHLIAFRSLIHIYYGFSLDENQFRSLAISACTIKLNFLISPYVLETLIAGCKIYCTKRVLFGDGTASRTCMLFLPPEFA